LRVISNYTQLLAKRYQDQLDDDADEFVDFIVDATKRMQELINDLLLYSRVQTKGQAFRTTNCNETVAVVLANLALAIEESGATVTVEQLPIVQADGSQMLQLFQNLISNAMKFKAQESPQINIWAHRENNFWVISVRDNGLGIDMKYAERIFIIFQRLHNREAYPGSGIGLAICKKIVERHGGKIWVESEPGRGTTFHFTIPAAAEEH
jgi:light-regulated signal transduction histidine kinase (bacteriophytochrome)